ncbi:response regulator [Tardiphaga alba]|uniref:Response regulator n=1 Tax=Tardiphaga alba TaxID=340268 RepID=A0ABX8AE76_9BRAD|nr:response regulator [Tardiphaga alba]QUS41968.1 response regulator [Tardiphaga alba]
MDGWFTPGNLEKRAHFRTGRSLLIVEECAAYALSLRHIFERRGYTVTLCNKPLQLPLYLAETPLDCAILELKLTGASGLECIKIIHQYDPSIRIVVVTGFASITTAVEAIKLGACYYLAKPCGPDEIEAAFERVSGDSMASVTPRATSIKSLEWERIHQTLAETRFNISEAARRLGIHRRTLVRKLAKRPIPHA